MTAKPCCSTVRASAGSGGPVVGSGATAPGHKRYRSCSMSPALSVGGTARLNSTSTGTSPGSGVTLARMKSGPIVNSGCGREARKSWPWAVAGPLARSKPASSNTRGMLNAHRDEFLGVVIVQRQPLLDDPVLEQRVLHGPERFDADRPVPGEERSGDLVGTERRLHAPPQLLRRDRGGVLGAGPHEVLGAEDRARRLADGLAVLLDRVFRGVLDLADPLRRHRVQAHQHLRLALLLGDGPPVAPDEGVDLLARQRGQLGIEPAQAHDLHVAIGIPALLLGHDLGEDPR